MEGWATIKASIFIIRLKDIKKALPLKTVRINNELRQIIPEDF